MLAPEAPWWNLTPTPLTFGEQDGVLLQDQEVSPPVLAVNVVPQAIQGPRGTQADGKWGWALRHALWKTDVKDLRNILRLT